MYSLHTQPAIQRVMCTLRILRVAITHIRFDIIESNNLYHHLHLKRNRRTESRGACQPLRLVACHLLRFFPRFTSTDRVKLTAKI